MGYTYILGRTRFFRRKDRVFRVIGQKVLLLMPMELVKY